MTHVDILGWIGTMLSLAFYLALAEKRVKIAYIALILSAFAWGYVGYMSDLSSLTVKEVVILLITLVGWRNWSKK
jgi:hypothetical protein